MSFKFKDSQQIYIDFLDQPVENALVKATKEWIEDWINRPNEKGIGGTDNDQKFKEHWKQFYGHDTSANVYTLKINLVPLNRVGATEGASGAKVFVTYFDIIRDNKPLERLSSPMILKFTEYTTTSKTNKLFDELMSFQKIEACIDYPNNFAIPACYKDVEDYKVAFLLSPFRSSTFPIQGKEKPVLQENNLWKLLINDDYLFNNDSHINFIKNLLKNTFHYLHSFHDSNVLENRTYAVEYEWYLRQLEKPGEAWIEKLEAMWEPKTVKSISNFGREFWNPLYVYAHVRDLENTFKIGAVHGDLHPRNIVIGFDQSANIIDFGWSTNGAHIVKDFVLMEANLRFASLHSKFKYDFVCVLAGALDTDKIKSIETHGVYELISEIRERCNDHYKFNGQDIDWTRDYLIPLFLVSLGLTKFIDTHNNLISTHLSLLEMSNYIASELNLK